MTAKTKKLVQSVLPVLLAAAALRFVLIVIYRARTQPPASGARADSAAGVGERRISLHLLSL